MYLYWWRQWSSLAAPHKICPTNYSTSYKKIITSVFRCFKKRCHIFLVSAKKMNIFCFCVFVWRVETFEDVVLSCGRCDAHFFLLFSDIWHCQTNTWTFISSDELQINGSFWYESFDRVTPASCLKVDGFICHIMLSFLQVCYAPIDASVSTFLTFKKIFYHQK